MKKLLKLSHSVIRGALLPVLAVGLGLVFWSATTAVVSAQTWQEQAAAAKTKPSDKPGKGKPDKPDKGKCDVCHNPHNYHTISIPCDQVDKFLSNHPGDFRGRCQATPVTNP
jgi:hypothetical protein